MEAISRVATGTYDMGFGDINSLIKLLDEDPSQKIGRPRQIYTGAAQRDYVAVDKR